jgi:hypothetical protein
MRPIENWPAQRAVGLTVSRVANESIAPASKPQRFSSGSRP